MSETLEKRVCTWRRDKSGIYHDNVRYWDDVRVVEVIRDELLKAAETARAHDHDHISNYRQCGNTIATEIERQAQ